MRVLEGGGDTGQGLGIEREYMNGPEATRGKFGGPGHGRRLCRGGLVEEQGEGVEMDIMKIHHIHVQNSQRTNKRTLKKRKRRPFSISTASLPLPPCCGPALHFTPIINPAASEDRIL